jgi:hypothetical protein
MTPSADVNISPVTVPQTPTSRAVIMDRAITLVPLL